MSKAYLDEVKELLARDEKYKRAVFKAWEEKNELGTYAQIRQAAPIPPRRTPDHSPVRAPKVSELGLEDRCRATD